MEQIADVKRDKKTGSFVVLKTEKTLITGEPPVQKPLVDVFCEKPENKDLKKLLVKLPSFYYKGSMYKSGNGQLGRPYMLWYGEEGIEQGEFFYYPLFVENVGCVSLPTHFLRANFSLFGLEGIHDRSVGFVGKANLLPGERADLDNLSPSGFEMELGSAGRYNISVDVFYEEEYVGSVKDYFVLSTGGWEGDGCLCGGGELRDARCCGLEF